MTAARDLKKLIRQDVQSMHAYAIQPRPADQARRDGEPAPAARPLQAELGARLGALALNRYPAGRSTTCAAPGRHARMPDGFDIMLGNGSDELISLVAMACDVPGAPSWRRCPAS
jgi:histidinol-phosphate aminotransferase